MFRKDLCATPSGFFDGPSAESIKKRFKHPHQSPSASENLVEENKASRSIDNRHPPDKMDEQTEAWTQLLGSDVTAGLASGATVFCPRTDLLGIITNWRDKVLELHSARSALEALTATTSPHTWYSAPVRLSRCPHLKTRHPSASIRTCPETLCRVTKGMCSYGPLY
ncbi:hypothetical protein FGIG_11886 [Fasciola gigantica]|uniref:Uncharacterized protein n=1 Tax=Fasciola gigantica TaxID=46835 RepID=A0A504YKK4_FASGI|nr:hypothetical protein FGIG_11886 [Fasciola gigantica]